MFKKLRLNVSLVIVITWITLSFAVQLTSQVWNSQLEGAESIVIHTEVNLGDYLVDSCDSRTAL